MILVQLIKNMIKKSFDPLAPCKHKQWRYMFNQQGEPTFRYCCNCTYFELITQKEKTEANNELRS